MYQLRTEQLLAAPVEKIWEFIASPGNLKLITPPDMGFTITTPQSSVPMYPGMIIGYIVAPFAGLKTRWITEITQVEPMRFFVDEQRVGPYRLWHHEHHVSAIDKKTTQMKDLVSYQLPFGCVGKCAHRAFVHKRLQSIFAFRRQKLTELFGAAS